MKIFPFDKALIAAHAIFLALFGGVLLLLAFSSLGWRMEQDTPLLHYAAFLMDRFNLAPYKDFFETSMPGSLAFHYLIGTLFGYGDMAFRVVDLVLLSILLSITYLFMSRFGRTPAIWAVCLFGIIYLIQGQAMSLQRDYLGVIPIAAALLTLPIRCEIHVQLYRFALVGLLFGLSFMIKPHLVIALPIIAGALMVCRWNSKEKSVYDFLLCGMVCTVAFLLPALIAVLWLASHSALSYFVDIFFEYLPMHTALNGKHVNVTGFPHAKYLFMETFKFGGYSVLFLSSLFAFHRVLLVCKSENVISISMVCLVLCTLAYAIYPTIAGKFWGYHYMPFVYFCSISSALCLYAWPGQETSGFLSKFGKAIPLIILLVAVSSQNELSNAVEKSLAGFESGSEGHAPKDGRVDEIANWLKSRLLPGDQVQPLDWTGGSIHAMLISEARLATRYLYDYHFYHHVSSDYTQGLRANFINLFSSAKPRFVVEVHTNKPWVSGVDTTREFPELEALMSANYKITYKGDGYAIYERNTM